MESTFDAGVKQYNLDKSYINLESMFARKKLQMQVGVSRPLPLKNGSPLLVEHGVAEEGGVDDLKTRSTPRHHDRPKQASTPGSCSP